MRIVTHGENHYKYTFTCNWCRCVFQCTDSEVVNAGGSRYLSHVSYHCPDCGVRCSQPIGKEKL